LLDTFAFALTSTTSSLTDPLFYSPHTSLNAGTFTLDSSLESPLGLEQESPFSEFLNSPVFASESGTASPPFELSYPSLFSNPSYSYAPTPALTPHAGSETTLRASPALPALPSVTSQTNSPHQPTPSTTAASDQASTAQTSRRGTGFRSPATPLVAIDAPIRPRNYLVDSTTSKKRKTAAVERELAKRGRTSASPDSEPASKATTEVTPEDAIPEDLAAAVERKRLQNTLSARKSRQRKQERLGELEERNKELETENEGLKQRVQALEAMAKAFGLTV